MTQATAVGHAARVALAAVLTLFMQAAAAAAFDCAQAATRVEKAVCGSSTLSALDEQLSRAYDAALAQAADPGAVRSRQQRWLRGTRNRCAGEACLQRAYEIRLTELAATPRVAWKTYRDAALGIEFVYPSNRVPRAGCHGSRRCIALAGRPRASTSDYLLALELFDGNLEQVAVEQAVFQKRPEGWIARGRTGEQPATLLNGPGWQGLSAVVGCGVSDGQGFHAEAGECLWAVLSDGRVSVVADTQGLAGHDEASMRTLQSLRFLRKSMARNPSGSPAGR